MMGLHLERVPIFGNRNRLTTCGIGPCYVTSLCEQQALHEGTVAVNLESLSRALTSDFPVKVKGLYPYQVAGVEYICRKRRVLLSDEMGVGKSAQAIAALYQLNLNYLVICPASLRDNWLREIKMWTGVDAQKFETKRAFNPNVPIIATYGQCVHSPAVTALLRHNFTALVCDECFVAGTLVDTPNGPKPIEWISVGSKVLNCAGEDEVVAVNSSITDCIVTINDRITCTQNHPFFTQRGWIAAAMLREGDYLIEIDEAMRMVQSGDVTGQESLLRNILLGEMADETTRNTSKNIQQGSNCKNTCGKHWAEKTEIFRMAQGKQLHVQSGSADEGKQVPESDWAQAKGTWWKWLWPNKTRANCDESFRRRMGIQFCRIHKQSPLQNRRCEPAAENCYRGRWALSRLFTPKRTRRKEGQWTKGVRVESIKIEKCGSRAVYNLQIRKHPSYSVNGVLVHNCHFLKNPRASRTQKILNKKLFLAQAKDALIFITGTPVENKPIEIYQVAHALGAIPESLSDFGNRYANPKLNYWSRRIEYEGVKNAPELAKRLRSQCLIRRTKAEVLPFLPPKVKREITLDVNPRELLKREMKYYGKEHLTAVEIEDLRNIRAQLAIIKAPYVIDYVRDALEASEKVVVFAWHRTILTELLIAFAAEATIITGSTPNAVRQSRVDYFTRNPKCRVFLGALTAAGVGFNMTEANHVIIAEASWKPGENEQAIDRCHRIGQAHSVLADFLCFPDSADQRVLKACKEKQSYIDAILR